MKGIGFVLKSLGINLSDEDIRQVEILVPQVPAKLQAAVALVNQTITNLDERQRAVETKLTALETTLHDAIREFHSMQLENLTSILSRLENVREDLKGEIHAGRTNIDSNHDHGAANGTVGGAGSVASAGTRHGRTLRNR